MAELQAQSRWPLPDPKEAQALIEQKLGALMYACEENAKLKEDWVDLNIRARALAKEMAAAAPEKVNGDAITLALVMLLGGIIVSMDNLSQNLPKDCLN